MGKGCLRTHLISLTPTVANKTGVRAQAPKREMKGGVCFPILFCMGWGILARDLPRAQLVHLCNGTITGLWGKPASGTV